MKVLDPASFVSSRWASANQQLMTSEGDKSIIRHPHVINTPKLLLEDLLDRGNIFQRNI